MATSTLRRQQQPPKTGTWSAIFPSEQVTEQQSALFVKKLLAVAISNITYLRTIFPEHAFGDRCLEDKFKLQICVNVDLSLKILRDDSACPGACQVIQWVKGCFDALDKKYLRMIVVGIYVDANNPNTVVETYTFRFDYNTKEGITIFRNGDEVTSAHTDAETRKATIKLLRTIVVLTQTLKPLPDDVMMTMKLFYYDDVTPADYEPPGFKSTPAADEFQFKDEPVIIKVGDVATAFHTVKLRIRTDSNQFDMVEDTAPASKDSKNETKLQAPDEDELSQNKTHVQQQEEEQTVQNVGASGAGEAVEPSLQDQASMDMSAEPETSTAVEEDNVVRCPCGCNEDDGLMVLCGECKVWQHAVCYGLLVESEVPELHVCEQCAQKSEGTKEGHPCTDPFLQFLNPVALQATCLWRRALAASVEFTRIPTQQFSKRLGVELSVAQGLINRLEREGFIKAPSKGKRLGKVVNKEKVRNDGIPKYFEKHSSKKSPSATNLKSGNSLEQMTEQASSLDISGSAPSKRKPRKQKALPDHVLTDDVRRSPRLMKRARSTVDEDVEFELSQDSQVRSQSKRRKKASIATRSILV